AGLFRNQETYAFLDPGETIRFSEYWMPVRDTGGISRANKVGVISFHEQGSNISASLNVNQRISGAQIRFMEKDQVLWSETTDLAPDKTWSHAVPLKDQSARVTFELKDHNDKLLLQHTDGQYDWDPDSTIKVGPQTIFGTPDVDKRTEGDWLKLGTDQELNGKI